MKWFAIVKINNQTYKVEFEDESGRITLAQAKEKVKEIVEQSFGHRDFRMVGPFSEVITPEPERKN